METLPRLTGALIQRLIEKGIVSLTEIQERLSELESEQEIAPLKKLCALVIGHKKSSPGAVNERADLTEEGKKMAEILLNHLVEHLKLPNRGIKPKTAEDRGGPLLRYTEAPCVIAEPFFIDNDSDLSKAQEDEDIDELAVAYTKAIEKISQIV